MCTSLSPVELTLLSAGCRDSLARICGVLAHHCDLIALRTKLTAVMPFPKLMEEFVSPKAYGSKVSKREREREKRRGSDMTTDMRSFKYILPVTHIKVHI